MRSRPSIWLSILLLSAACGGSDGGSDTAGVLPDGPQDPRAYTEEFLTRNPQAVLRLAHLAIVDLQPEDATDRVAYHVERPTTLELAIDDGADQLSALSLHDRRGQEVGRVDLGRSTTVSLQPGRHVIVLHHVASDTAPKVRQMVFLKPQLGADGTVTALAASKSCVDCSFDRAQLSNQDFDGANLMGCTMHGARIFECTFRGANMNTCDFSAGTFTTEISSSDFSGANLVFTKFNSVLLDQVVFGGPPPTPPADLSYAHFGIIENPTALTAFSGLNEVTFDRAKLLEAKFRGTIMVTATFNGADMSGADFTATGTVILGPEPRHTRCDQCDFSVEAATGKATNLSNAIFSTPDTNQFLLQSGNSFAGADLSGAQLANGDFSNLIFANANLNRAALMGATLSGSSLSGATLHSANLSGAVAVGADLNQADLTGATLTNVSLQGSNLDYVSLVNADLAGAQLGAAQSDSATPASMIGAYMPNVNLSSADLRYVDLSYAHLYGDTATTSLSGALLDGANLSNAICSGAQFTGASLTGTVLDGAQLVNCSFAGADLTDASFDKAYLQGADFSGVASVSGARFSNAALSTMAGVWTFQEQNGMPVDYMYDATGLGSLATDPTVICPNGDRGLCTGDKLEPIGNGPIPPIPTCVPLPPSYNNCTAPSESLPTPTPAPPA